MFIGILFFLLWIKRIRPGSVFTRIRIENKGDLFLLSFAGLVRAFSIGIILIRLAGSVSPFWADWCDDLIAYFYFPKYILQTGSFIEPFSFRRLVMLGGAPYLQSFLYPVFGPSSLPFLDAGLGSILLWGIALECVNRNSKSPMEILKKELISFASLMFAMAVILYNHAPVLLPCALLLGLMTLSTRIIKNGFEISAMIITAMISAALISIRNNYVIFVAVFLLLLFIFVFKGSKSEKSRGVLMVSCSILLCLVPWLALSYKSSGTPFFPLFRGFYTFPFLLSQPMHLFEKITFVGDKLWSSKSLVLVYFMLLAIFMKENGKLVLIIAVSTLSTIIIMSLSLTASDSFNIYRYLQPFIFAGILASAGIVSGTQFLAYSSKKNILIVSGLLLSLWWTFWPSRMIFSGTVTRTFQLKHSDLILSNSKDFVAGARRAFASAFECPKLDDSHSYKEVQDFLPAGSKILSVADAPFNWDFRRDNIHMIDCIGQTSPPPGLPSFSGPEPVRNYLRKLGYRYIVYTPFEFSSCLYSYRRWIQLSSQGAFIYRQWAPFFLDFFGNIAILEKNGSVIFQNADLKVIDLNYSSRR
jgi:hypothetical protein